MEPVAIRHDANWNVPEPELALVINPAKELIGYTIGNDMSSRDIEGENPLYLPQAKMYGRCCAVGPMIALTEHIPDGKDLTIAIEIQRNGTVAFAGTVHTSKIVRSFPELLDYLGRDNIFPDGVLLLTGTGIVPADDFTLESGDSVSISIDGIGTLHNPVIRGGA
jgi:2-dehydro-3-deoxy-D-arabinonate dehydratase